MYKLDTNNNIKNNKLIKPRRILVGGVIHNVSDTGSLIQLREAHQEKMKNNQEELLDQMNSRKLIVHSGQSNKKINSINNSIKDKKRERIEAKPQVNVIRINKNTKSSNDRSLKRTEESTSSVKRIGKTITNIKKEDKTVSDKIQKINYIKKQIGKNSDKNSNTDTDQLKKSEISEKKVITVKKKGTSIIKSFKEPSSVEGIHLETFVKNSTQEDVEEPKIKFEIKKKGISIIKSPKKPSIVEEIHEETFVKNSGNNDIDNQEDVDEPKIKFEIKKKGISIIKSFKEPSSVEGIHLETFVKNSDNNDIDNQEDVGEPKIKFEIKKKGSAITTTLNKNKSILMNINYTNTNFTDSSKKDKQVRFVDNISSETFSEQNRFSETTENIEKWSNEEYLKKDTDTQSLVVSGSNSQKQVFTEQFDVVNNQWYILGLKINGKKNGLLKLVNSNKSPLLPLIKLPNKIFFYKLDNEDLNEYRIYFLNCSSNIVSLYVVGTEVITYIMQPVFIDDLIQNINLWKFRKYYDLEFINYFLPFTKKSYNDKFIDRFKADYNLYTNPNYFDDFIKDIENVVKKPLEYNNIIKNSPINVLYLIYTSIEYETIGYTLRSQDLLKNTSNSKYQLYGVTRYGYPYDRETSYYNKDPEENYSNNGVKYIKLLNKDDNYNNNNIIEYLKKYILSIINLCISNNVKIIHSTSNYWNGVTGYYAAKYLGIKSIYEIREFWNEKAAYNNIELKESDMIKMMVNIEQKIYEGVDKILTINNCMKNRLIGKNIDKEKIVVISDSVDLEVYNKIEHNNQNLREKYNFNEDNFIIGFVGSINLYEGIDNIIEVIKMLKENYFNIVFFVIGDGIYKHEMLSKISKHQLKENFIHVDKLCHPEVIKHYDMFDLLIYPRKDCNVSNLTGSYKILEAMILEKPVIVSEIESTIELFNINSENKEPEFISDDFVVYCKPDDINDLYEKTVGLINNKELRDKIGCNSKKKIIKDYNWNKTSKKIRKVYHELIDHSNVI